jgi:hypothetical protein
VVRKVVNDVGNAVDQECKRRGQHERPRTVYRGDDQNDGEGKVESADITHEVFVERTVDTDPYATKTWVRVVEGLRRELRPSPDFEADESEESECNAHPFHGRHRIA